VWGHKVFGVSRVVGLLVLTVRLSTAVAQTFLPVMDAADEWHLARALDVLALEPVATEFDKDVAEPEWALERIRRLLAEPMGLPGLADEIAVASGPGCTTSLWTLAGRLLEVTPEGVGEGEDEVALPDLSVPLSIPLRHGIREFLRCCRRAEGLLDVAYGRVGEDERRYAAGSVLGGILNIEDDEDARRALREQGLAEELVAEVIREGTAVDPAPSSLRQLAVMRGIELGAVVRAAVVVRDGVSALGAAVARVEEWPAVPVRATAGGLVVIVGTRGDDVHAEPAALVLDPGGDDVYRGAAARADGLGGTMVSVVLDLAGDDRYVGRGVLGPGSALFGICGIEDVRGDDVYDGRYTGAAAAFFGAAWLRDMEGNDRYRVTAHGQGAATCGAAFLCDASGHDVYEAGYYAQGFAGVRAVGLLVDSGGNDRYMAGGVLPDYERHPDRYLSLAQGFSTGMRPFAGGGVAALVDWGGNDVYVADVYGQGVSYWYSAGFLLDAEGHDAYTVHHYGQGSGIHLSLGLLADGAGNDVYSGAILAQGNAHDYAVGMLFDHGGDDTYTADHYSQGKALNTAMALLVDRSGKDGYFARRPALCQGAGDDGGRREARSLSVLLDLGGKDRYTCGAVDGVALLRNDDGIVYDAADPEGGER